MSHCKVHRVQNLNVGPAADAPAEWVNNNLRSTEVDDADEARIQRSYTAEVCISCTWFTYGMDAHCHTCVGCALMQAQPEQGQHLTHGCRNWKPVHHVETGPAVAA